MFSAVFALIALIAAVQGQTGCSNPEYQACNLFSADNRFSLCVNGVLRGSSENWYDVYAIVDSLKAGDMVAVKARDYGVAYGFGATIRMNGFNHDTTNISVWYGVDATSTPDSDPWCTTYSADICAWPNAVVGTTAPNFGRSKWLTTLGTTFIWAQRAGVKSKVYLRTKIGSSKLC